MKERLHAGDELEVVAELVNKAYPGRGQQAVIAKLIRPIDDRLAWFRVHRSRAEGLAPINSLDLEFLARDVARCVGKNTRHALAHCASWFEGFDQEQRRVVYRLLFALRRCRRELRHQWLRSMLAGDPQVDDG